MKKKPFQVLVFPYILQNEIYKYCLFLRKDMNVWQGIAGGGELGERPIKAAMRETFEEAGIKKGKIIPLKTKCYMPSVAVNKELINNGIVVIPEYCFGIGIELENCIRLSDEHSEFKWVNYDEAQALLHWDSNRTALWELNYRLNNK